MRLLALLGDLEDLEVVLVELVVGETGAQCRGALLGEVLVDVGEPLGEVVVDDRLVVVLVALVGHGVSSEVWCARRRAAALSHRLGLRSPDHADHGIDGLLEVELRGIDRGHARLRRS